MDDALHQAVSAALADVFEKMFFTLLEPLTDLPPQEEWGEEEGFVEASIGYTGELAGVLHFYFPLELARAITSNFLGGDEVEVGEAQMLDTVREAVNMAVGSMLGRIDPEGHCTLGIPEAHPAENFSPESLIADLGLYVFRTSFGNLWLVCGPQ